MQANGLNLTFMFLILAACTFGAAANAFLGQSAGEGASAPHRDVLQLLEEELGRDHGRADAARVAALEAELAHTFAALPRDGQGRLGAQGARYALHRLFVERHAWQLSGLEPGGAGWANGSAADALGDRVPERVRALFGERLAGAGVSLHELAVLAALLETMVHTETDERLRIALRAFGKDERSELGRAAATAVLHAYMASYVLGVPLAELSPEAVRKHAESVEKAYPTWPDTQAFVAEVRDEVAPGASRYDFRLLADVLERVADRYGRWQSKECSALKQTLVGMEARPGSGRVRLSDFYGSALRGENWQFSESMDYLRQLGALDEAGAGEPAVIIPNYINSPSNCVASSGYYAVCCVDECEEIVDHLERRLRAPAASPAEVLSALQGSATAPGGGNGTLPAALLRRLEDVAAHHGGQVALHGRLFAQWLHYAYPRECPFPHVSGTVNPLTAEAFAAQTGAPVTASGEEMRHFVSAAPRARATEAKAGEEEGDEEDGLCSQLWTMEEELVDATAHAAHAAERAGGGLRAAARIVALCLAAGSAVISLVTLAAPLFGALSDSAAKPRRAVAMAPATARQPVTYAV